MGLINVARHSIAVTLGIADAMWTLFEREYLGGPRQGLAAEGEFDWSGPDDMWPDIPWPEEPVIADTESEPELLVTRQWGLVLPSGEIAWNCWAGISFGDPFNRTLMVAKLKKTGMDVGFAEEQLGEWLSNYAWVTRNEIATIVYEDTGGYDLTDPQVSALDDAGLGLQRCENESENDPGPGPSTNGNGPDPAPDLHRGPLGGSAP
jgi:hypothetical protein